MEEIIFWMEDAADSGVKKIADKVAGDVELVTDRRPRVLYGTSQEELADVAERAETVIVPATVGKSRLLEQMEEEKKKSQTYEALFKAYTAYVQESYDVAAENLQNVYEEYLTDDMKNVYSAMCGSLGVTGVTSESQEDGNSESGSASSDESGSGSSEDGTF